MDGDYCSVRFMRMLKTINIIHQIQISLEFSDFYHWLNDFYQVEMRELIGDICGEFSLKDGNFENTLDIEKKVSSYIFDCIQYGRNKINRGSEALLIKHLDNDLFVKETDQLCLKFKKLLVGNEQLKEAYIKLTEYIDIRYLVLYRFNAEHLFLTWFSIENHFSRLEQRKTPLTHDEYSTVKKFEAEIYRYLHDFEILAKNKGYEIGHVTLTDSAMFKDDAHSEDYLTLRLAENFRVPVVDALLDYLEFATYKLNLTLSSTGADRPNTSRLKQLERIIQLLNAEKFKKTTKKGTGLINLLCHTVYKLKQQELALKRPVKYKSDNTKHLFDYIANLLESVGIKYSYNAAAKDKSNLKLVVHFTETAIRNNLFALYFKFLAKTRSVTKSPNYMISNETNLSAPHVLDSTHSFDLYRNITQNVSVNRGKKLFDITANNLGTKMYTEKVKPFSFASLYTDE